MSEGVSHRVGLDFRMLFCVIAEPDPPIRPSTDLYWASNRTKLDSSTQGCDPSDIIYTFSAN